jgi:hypothetical protein
MMTQACEPFSLPLFIRAYLALIRADLQLTCRGFAAVHRAVKNFALNGNRAETATPEAVCGAVDVACAFYFKEVLCLQRSAATTCLLRRSGIPAEMVIGVQQWPFRAHAWVEVKGRIANDRPYIADIYGVLDRC